MRKITKKIREITIPNDSICSKKGGLTATRNMNTQFTTNGSHIALNIKKNGIDCTDINSAIVMSQKFNRVADDQAYSRVVAREYLNIEGELIPILKLREQRKYPSYASVCSDSLLLKIAGRITTISKGFDKYNKLTSFAEEEKSSYPFMRNYYWRSQKITTDFNTTSFGGRKINENYSIIAGRDILHSIQFIGTPMYVYVANLMKLSMQDPSAELLVKIDVNPDQKVLSSTKLKDLVHYIIDYNTESAEAVFRSKKASNEFVGMIADVTNSHPNTKLYLSLKLHSNALVGAHIDKMSFGLMMITSDGEAHRSPECIVYAENTLTENLILRQVRDGFQEIPYKNVFFHTLVTILTDTGSMFRISDEYDQRMSRNFKVNEECSTSELAAAFPSAYSNSMIWGSLTSNMMNAIQRKYEKSFSYLCNKKDYGAVMSSVMANCSVIAHEISPTEVQLGYSLIVKEKSMYVLYLFDETDSNGKNEMHKLLAAKTLSTLETRILNYIKAEKLTVVVNALPPTLSTATIAIGNRNVTSKIGSSRIYKKIIERLPSTMKYTPSEDDDKFPGRVLIRKKKIRELKSELGSSIDITSVGSAISGIYEKNKQECKFFLPNFIKLDIIENYLKYELGISMPRIEVDLIDSYGFFPTMYNYFIFSFNRDRVDFVAPFVTGIKKDEVVEELKDTTVIEKELSVSCSIDISNGAYLRLLTYFVISQFVNEVDYSVLLTNTKIRMYNANGGGISQILSFINSKTTKQQIELRGDNYEEKIRWSINY